MRKPRRTFIGEFSKPESQKQKYDISKMTVAKRCKTLQNVAFEPFTPVFSEKTWVLLQRRNAQKALQHVALRCIRVD
jgi:hypothetical protein